jgi:hypothetical protein
MDSIVWKSYFYFFLSQPGKIGIRQEATNGWLVMEDIALLIVDQYRHNLFVTLPSAYLSS